MSKRSKLIGHENDIIQKYSTGKYTLSSLGREFGVDNSQIKKVLVRNNINIFHDHHLMHRKYSLNENYFDILDTKEKLYYLGIISSDGCLKDNNVISIDLTESDYQILENLKIELQTEKPLYFDKRKPPRKNSYRLSISSSKIQSRLSELGCVKRKSFKLVFPSKVLFNEQMIQNYLRGFWMGNGSLGISIRKNRKYNELFCSVVSTKEFCEELKDILYNLIDIHCSICEVNKRRTNIRRLSISGSNQIIQFLDWLYNDIESCFDRKYYKYLEIKTLIEKGLLHDYLK